MSDQAPDLWERFRAWVFGRFGVPGLIVLACAAAAFFVWTKWDSVRTWPGVSWIVEALSRESVPKADDPERFSVLVAHLENDTHGRDHERLLVDLLRDFPAVQILRLDRMIPVEGPIPERMEQQGHETARAFLKRSGASILIWGSVLQYGGQTKPKLYLTTSAAKARAGKQYTPETGPEFRLPEVFWSDLAQVLRLAIASLDAEFRAKEGNYVADRLPPFIARVRLLLNESRDRPGWDADARGSTLVVLADALQTLGYQKGDSASLEEAFEAYRAALQERTRERVPLDWATTQNNLGTALRTLGEWESGTQRLEEAFEAYRAALQERTRERVPLGWAMTQNNLGNALTTLGERENDTKRLQEAVTAYRAALQERTRERVPLDWATTQNNLGNALMTLGHWEEAVEAYHAALQVEPSERGRGSRLSEAFLRRLDETTGDEAGRPTTRGSSGASP